jgi:hypothetical protein
MARKTAMFQSEINGMVIVQGELSTSMFQQLTAKGTA